MTWLWTLWRWFAASKAAQIALMVVAALGGKVVYDRHQRDKGRNEAEQEAQNDAQKRVDKGRDAVRDGRGDDPDERLRNNDGKW